jgi:DNA polymerase III alpha subunit
MPDFDIDFCMSRRDRVIEYVADRYGRDRVSQIITFGSLAAKAVVRDVGRVLGMPYGFVDGVAKLIPFELGITLEQALEKEPSSSAATAPRTRCATSIDLAQRSKASRGMPARTRGRRHRAVAAHGLHRALLRSGQPSLVTQFDKDDVEQVGAREVRLPRAAHAHDHRLGRAPHQREAARGRRGAARPRAVAARRRRDVQLLRSGRTTASSSSSRAA